MNKNPKPLSSETIAALFTSLFVIAIMGHNGTHETFGLKAEDDSSTV